MKVLLKIIYRTLIYTSPVWLFYSYMEFRLGSLENSYSHKIKNFTKIKDSCDILILGNSQLLKGVNPAILSEHAFNMANVSQTLPVDAAILEKYLRTMPVLREVILGLSYTSFGEDLETGDESWRLSFYKKHYGISLKEKTDLRDYSNMLRYTPYESLKIASGNFKIDLIHGLQANGWMQVDGCDSAGLNDKWAMHRALVHTRSLETKNIQMNLQALEHMIEMLNLRGIKIKIVCPMVRQEYYKNLNPEWVERNDSIMRYIRDKYSIRFLDYSKSTDTKPEQSINYFNDVDHLNSKGAEKFSLMLRED